MVSKAEFVASHVRDTEIGFMYQDEMSVLV